MNKKLEQVQKEALALCAPVFHEMEEISLYNTEKVLSAFRKHHLSAYHFAPSNGYGYGDPGREKLEEIWCDVFHAESALVRPHFVSGTHALATVLLALLEPGDTMVSAVGAPYDTMESVIGITGNAPGNLISKGVHYKEVPLKGNTYDLQAISDAVDENTKLVEIQRSRGYMLRDSLFPSDMKKIIDTVKAKIRTPSALWITATENLPIKRNLSNWGLILQPVPSLKTPAAVWLLPVPISAAEKTWWNAAPMCGLHRALVEKWVPMPLPTVLSSKDSSWHPI